MALRIFYRKFSTSRQMRAMIDEQFTPEKLKDYCKPEVIQGVNMWKKITLFFAFPACLLASIYCINGHIEHGKHEKRSEFIPYEHLRIRTRRFPWGNGDQTLFHNPKYNATTQGYEVDEE
ncbi:cytochrome c oxidase subunit 6A2, mitochondrial-like [Daktulosphaira vitifoliae]|uniref:cytochrome c oxidase subunit 6A2, mitochondrial-like n=1 Tax=Daktulosphaira vitifoliae TaxID=58002 RepID=UPI0021AA8E60|nr:cytochrome c oxidase subunit 6A2, mitochondrial-like [Daktulosphaira vitifoliae]